MGILEVFGLVRLRLYRVALQVKLVGVLGLIALRSGLYRPGSGPKRGPLIPAAFGSEGQCCNPRLCLLLRVEPILNPVRVL
jgi:hypothetical protein